MGNGSSGGTRAREQPSAFERVYSLVIVGKGLYGVLELIAGAVLLVAPAVTSALLTSVALELAEGRVALTDAVARSLAAAGLGVAAGAVPFGLFLVVHGVVKILTATALVRRAARWYPWALGALGALLVVQLVDLVLAPSVGAAVLTVLDVAVLALVVWEYRHLRRSVPSRPRAVDGVPRADAPSGALELDRVPRGRAQPGPTA